MLCHNVSFVTYFNGKAMPRYTKNNNSGTKYLYIIIDLPIFAFNLAEIRPFVLKYHRRSDQDLEI